MLHSGEVAIVGTETAQDSGWTVIDAFDVMVHLFLADARERYGLERLWRDATGVSISKLLSQAKKPKAKAGKTPVPRRRKSS